MRMPSSKGTTESRGKGLRAMSTCDSSTGAAGPPRHERADGGSLGQDLETLRSVRSVKREIAAVESEDPVDPLPFRDSDERGVGKIHRQVLIFLHQLSHPRKIRQLQGEKRDSPALDELP